jgi:hypothetical protein
MPVATPAPHDDDLGSARAACNSTYPALRYIAGLFVAPGSTRRRHARLTATRPPQAQRVILIFLSVLYAIRRIIVWRLSPRQAVPNIRRIKCSTAGDSLLPPELGRLANAKGRGPMEGPGFSSADIRSRSRRSSSIGAWIAAKSSAARGRVTFPPSILLMESRPAPPRITVVRM